MAPEIFKMQGNIKAYKSPVDIWACGVMMYQLISGRYPFFDKDEAELIDFICNDAVNFRHRVF